MMPITNFDEIYVQQEKAKENQIKYLENLYSTGTYGQKEWARAQLAGYSISKPAVPVGAVTTQPIKPTPTMQTSGNAQASNTITSDSGVLTSGGNEITSGTQDTVKSNYLPIIIIGFIALLFLGD